MQIGFIGLGHMGNPMAKNLLKAGHTVAVFDVMPAAVKSLTDQGATQSTLQDIAKNSDVIFTMLQTGDQVRDVCLNPDGIFSLAKKNSLYIDCSSIEIAMTRDLHNEAEKRNIAMLDAPVSGGVAGAEAATLTFMVGGKDETFTRAKTILENLGKKIIHAGQAGSGQAAKICNNLILGISMIAVSEGFALGQKLGLDPKKFFEISSNASGQCWSMTNYCPVPGLVEKAPSNNHYKPGFTAKMMLKDLRLAQHAAENVSANIPLGAEAAVLYSLFINQGRGDWDFSGIFDFINSKK
jgi:3-hydroxyisobutyrate dehydrogenase